MTRLAFHFRTLAHFLGVRGRTWLLCRWAEPGNPRQARQRSGADAALTDFQIPGRLLLLELPIIKANSSHCCSFHVAGEWAGYNMAWGGGDKELWRQGWVASMFSRQRKAFILKRYGIIEHSVRYMNK